MLRAIALILFILSGALHADSPPQPNRAMMVLRDNCISCHNEEKKKGGLLLTNREAMLKGGDDGVVVIPGDANKSPLIAALKADADPHMPPKKQLEPADIVALTAWVNAGAAWDAKALVVAPSTRPVELRAMPDSYRPVLALSLSPDETRLAAGRGGWVFVYDVSKPEPLVIAKFEVDKDAVQSLAWSNDGKCLAAGGFKQIAVCDLESGKLAIQYTGLVGRVTALVLLSDGVTLIAADGMPGQTSTIRVWKLPSIRPVAEWPAHLDTVLSLTASRDGKTLFSSGADRLVKIWDLETFKEKGKLEGHAGHVLALALSADEAMLASAGADREIKEWDLKTRDLKKAISAQPDVITGLAWNADGKSLYSSSEDGAIRSHNEANPAGRLVGKAEDVIYCIALARESKRIYAGCHDGAVYIWETDGKSIGTLK